MPKLHTTGERPVSCHYSWAYVDLRMLVIAVMLHRTAFLLAIACYHGLLLLLFGGDMLEHIVACLACNNVLQCIMGKAGSNSKPWQQTTAKVNGMCQAPDTQKFSLSPRLEWQAPVDGALVGANQLFLFLQKPDGCLKGKHCAAAATRRCHHLHTLLQRLCSLVLPQSRPVAQQDGASTTLSFEGHQCILPGKAVGSVRLESVSVCQDKGWLHRARLPATLGLLNFFKVLPVVASFSKLCQ